MQLAGWDPLNPVATYAHPRLDLSTVPSGSAIHRIQPLLAPSFGTSKRGTFNGTLKGELRDTPGYGLLSYHMPIERSSILVSQFEGDRKGDVLQGAHPNLVDLLGVRTTAGLRAF